MSLFLIVIMLITVFSDILRKSLVTFLTEKLCRYIKIENFRKYIGVNSIFLICLINYPIYYIWVYMRQNDFLSIEIIQFDSALNLINIELISVALLLFLYIAFPMLIKIKGIDKIFGKKLIIFISTLIYLTFFLEFYNIDNLNYEAVCSGLVLTIFLGLGFYPRILPFEEQIKYWYFGLIATIGILMIPLIPCIGNNYIAQRILFNGNLGAFYVEAFDQFENHRLKFKEPIYLGIRLPQVIKDHSYCLLLRTNNFYYLSRNNEIILMNAESSRLSYPKNKKMCRFK